MIIESVNQATASGRLNMLNLGSRNSKETLRLQLFIKNVVKLRLNYGSRERPFLVLVFYSLQS